MARFAQILGHDGSQYAAKADELKRLINTKWLDRSKALYANGSQAAQSVALYLGLVPQELQQTVADNLSKMIAANGNYLDCGMMIFDADKQDVHAGGSGCGCCASVLAAYILPMMRTGLYKNVLVAATGALMSPTMNQQGESIPAISHLIRLTV